MIASNIADALHENKRSAMKPTKISARFGIAPVDTAGQQDTRKAIHGEVDLAIPTVTVKEAENALIARAMVRSSSGIRALDRDRTERVLIRRVRVADRLYAPTTIPDRGVRSTPQARLAHWISRQLIEDLRTFGIEDLVAAQKQINSVDQAAPEIQGRVRDVAEWMRDLAKEKFVFIGRDLFVRSTAPAIAISPTYYSPPIAVRPDVRQGFTTLKLEDSKPSLDDFAFSLDRFDAAKNFADRASMRGRDPVICLEPLIAGIEIERFEGDDLFVNEPSRNATAGLRLLMSAAKEAIATADQAPIAAFTHLLEVSERILAGDAAAPGELIVSVRELQGEGYLLVGATDRRLERMNRSANQLLQAMACSRPIPTLEPAPGATS